VIDTCQRGKLIISFDRLLRFAFSEDMASMWRNTHGHGVKINHQSMQRITTCVGSRLFQLKTMLHQDVTTCNVTAMFEISHIGDQPGCFVFARMRETEIVTCRNIVMVPWESDELSSGRVSDRSFQERNAMRWCLAQPKERPGNEGIRCTGTPVFF